MLYGGGMGYAILRTQKLKSPVAVRRSMKHAFREQDTPNADAERTPGNTHMGAESTDEALAKVAALLPEKRRSDAVLCVEYLVTASPEAMAGKSRAEQDAYLMDSLEWIRKRHGAANVVYAGIHRDERTPHLYAYAVPLDADTGRLNAKKWLGGPRALSQMQTDFAENVGKAHGLERGIEGSKARHTAVRDWYAQIGRTEPMPSIDVPEPRIADRVNPRAYGERVAKAVVAQLQPERANMQAKAATATSDRQKAISAQATADDLGKRLKHSQGEAAKLMQPFKGLTREQVQAVIGKAAEFQRENAAKRAQEQARAAPARGKGQEGPER